MAQIKFLRKGTQRKQFVFIEDSDGDVALSAREYNRARTIAKIIKKHTSL